ncbi:MAG: AI-2E family transporter [Candidatus Tectimicrobiota bacterium]
MVRRPDGPAVLSGYDLAAWVLMGLVLILILHWRVLPALLSGLLVYELVHLLAPRFRLVRISQEQGKLAAVAILAMAIAGLLTLAVLGSVAFFHSETGNVPALLQHMANVIDRWRTTLPLWLVGYLPDDLGELKEITVQWLRDNAGILQHAGAEAGRVFAHVLIGLGIGALVALQDAQPCAELGPLAKALQQRSARLADAFRRIVFAQVRISLLNTVFTGLYLVVGLPLAGVFLPLAKTLIAVTFFAGLVPIVGNLVSCSMIVVISLSVSMSAALASLVFLLVIHKLEYFMNAHIIGSHIHARAWELLIAMLLMEAAFGLGGVIAAPIYYAYIKDELVSQELI